MHRQVPSIARLGGALLLAVLLGACNGSTEEAPDAGAKGAEPGMQKASSKRPPKASPMPGLPFENIHGDPVTIPQRGLDAVTVLVFITTDCPIANGYAPQLQELKAGLDPSKVRFYLVHVDADLTLEAARKHANDYSHKGAILLDPEHRLVSRVGATITPEAAVLDKTGALRYLGRINNWYGDIGRKRVNISKHELRDAIQAVLAGQPVAVSQSEAVGCSIEPLDPGK